MKRKCPACGARLRSHRGGHVCPAGAAAPSASAAARAPIPFDAPARKGLSWSLWHTWREATLSPRDFYGRVPAATGLFWPLVYAVLFWLAAVLTVVFYQPLVDAALAAVPYSVRAPGEFLRATPQLQALLLILGPAHAIGTALLMAAVYGGLLTFVGAPAPFRVRLRVVCYTYGALVLALVPLLGWLLAPIAWTVLLVVGMARAHATETWRGAFAVVLPGFVGLGLLAALMLRLAAMLLQRLGSG